MGVCTVKDHGVATLQKRSNLENCICRGSVKKFVLPLLYILIKNELWMNNLLLTALQKRNYFK